MNDGLLREYLLGRLAEAERHEIENRAFEDDEFEDRLREVESDLLDDWARGQIPETDRSAIEARFSSEKLAAAQSINRAATLAHPGRSAPARDSRPWLIWMAVAAAIFLALIPAGYFWREAGRLRTELEVAKNRPAPSFGPAPPIVTLALNFPSTRGASPPVFTIPAAAGLVQVVMDAAPGYPFYEVRVESADRGLVFSQGVRGTNSGLALHIPTPLLPAGDYDFVLSGQHDGSTTLLATYSCRIRH